jgi:hypothetical protein
MQHMGELKQQRTAGLTARFTQASINMPYLRYGYQACPTS